MEITWREFWTAGHGIVLGGGFLLTFSGAFLCIWNLRQDRLTPEGIERAGRQAIAATWGMAILAWAAVILGTYLIYPWYRATPPAGAALADYPKFLLLAKPSTAGWHDLGMEWKEHIAWFSPILATAVAAVITSASHRVGRDVLLRRMVLGLLSASFACAAVAGLLGR